MGYAVVGTSVNKAEMDEKQQKVTILLWNIYGFCTTIATYVQVASYVRTYLNASCLYSW